jgi:hypothetical protein
MESKLEGRRRIRKLKLRWLDGVGGWGESVSVISVEKISRNYKQFFY